ncbi:1-acyl-sn-glycerol-3-phosphate acyltransferase [Lysobacter helvus]|uniref:1-acyl-sn-glycerol-3-phosphate acyltransferase n=2 Tax=Lysobacteraceae TaxID=32033 RepID=A0ABM7Q384_9GAMM|nr:MULTISPECIES: lysophospholipid acyltransferase family protein [Lysobacter]BCT91728.1 1-acyl-sn-glycerol-3-phosphate acyltransferase [Lysobacter caseinilyticus]BCT94881.1 1-acyl-sn-glycerol-3-phosphate acyltransferase [Lysobacter helvus]
MAVVIRPTLPAFLPAAGWFALNALQLFALIVFTVAGIPVALLVALLRGPAPALRMARWYWAPLLLGGAGVDLVVEGTDRVAWDKPLVLVSNHASMMDIVVLFRAVPAPLRFMLKRELAMVPFVGWYARAMGMVFIDRGNARDARRKLGDAVDKLRDGATLVAFPEGTRSKDGHVGAFKGGAFQVAIEAGVPVVPVTITGSGAVLPPSGFRVRPGTIVVRFGDPIATEGMSVQARNALAQQARERVVSMANGGA